MDAEEFRNQLGQIAYETWRRDRRLHKTWHQIGERTREHWRAAAQSVCNWHQYDLQQRGLILTEQSKDE